MFAKHIIHCYIIFYMLYTILLYVLQYTILLYVFCHISASRRQNANSIHMYTNTSTYIHTYVHIYITASRKRWSSLRRSGEKKIVIFVLFFFVIFHIHTYMIFEIFQNIHIYQLQGSAGAAGGDRELPFFVIFHIYVCICIFHIYVCYLNYLIYVPQLQGG